MFKVSAGFALFGALSILLPPLSAEDANSHVVVKSRFNNVWTADSTSGKVNIGLREIRVEVAGPYGRPVPERIVVLFEPESRVFSWFVVGEDSRAADTSRQTRALEKERVVFFRDGSLVIFMGGISPKLYVRDFRDNAISMDDAEAKALIASTEFHNPPDMQDEEKLWHTVMLKKALGLDFVLPPGSEGGELLPKVTGVQWDGDKQHWIVTLQARWKAEITLDADYKLVSMKRVE
jgi:hypothetical protein